MITDLIGEIYTSMSRNKLRIALTGFSIAWGIFLLIVLLGAGNGLMNGTSELLASQTVNRVDLYPGYTSIEKDGLPKWRDIYLDERDVEYLRGLFPRQVSQVQPQITAGTTLSVGENHVSTSFQGIYPEAIAQSGNTIALGRGINEMDIRERRKVCVLHEEMAADLYPTTAEALGQWVNASGLKFQCVGIFKTKSVNRDQRPYIPISTASSIFQPDHHYSNVMLQVQNLESIEANKAFNDTLRQILARRKQFDTADYSAIWIDNTYEDYLSTQVAFSGIRLLIWIIGIASLIAGVTGISNIMLITVRERTHEFGIRKAIGARPAEIVRLVIFESIAITLVFGYIGLLCGLGLTELVSFVLNLSQQSASEESFSMFKDPTVDLSIVMAATLVMVIAGVIAGYIPAKRAVSIKPIEALTSN